MTYSEYRLWEEPSSNDREPSTTVDDAMRMAGWTAQIGIGPTDGAMWVSTWFREVNGAEEHVAYLGDAGDDGPMIRTDSYLELTDLLARWAPIVQAHAVTVFLNDLRSGETSGHDVVSLVTAKVLRRLR